MRFSVERCAASPTQIRTWREAPVYLELGNHWHTIRCLSSQQRVSFLTEWHRTCRQVGATTPVGELDTVAEDLRHV